MSFFGFDSSLPGDRRGNSNGSQQVGGGFFGSRQDPFAGYSGQAGEGEEVLNFDDTYDGLGDNLVEAGDDLNDDTFGDSGKIGKDFDFSGQTADARGTLLEEEALHYARQPPPKTQVHPQQAYQQQPYVQSSYAQPQYQQPTRPVKSGYENYRQDDYIPQLEASASIWGLPNKKTQEAPPPTRQADDFASASSRKMMSLEEVEAAMRAQSAKTVQQATPQIPAQPQSQQQLPYDQLVPGQHPGAPHVLQRPPPTGPAQNFQRPQPPAGPPAGGLPPFQILQNHNRVPSQPHGSLPHGHPGQLGHARGPSAQLAQNAPMTQHISNLSEQQKEMYLAEEAKRAKRNHKIFLLSKDNGIMTPQDKNFITRIQLQQLVAASGGIDEAGPEAELAEDFYYQVYTQIRGAPRQNPNQPLSHFAQTYLFQTGARYGSGRRNQRGGDSHVQRMEQQVQRAVEAARARPKNKQLTVEGSLGKIAFSNSKTPRPLLNFKRPDVEAKLHGKGAKVTFADRKATLRDIERCYATLMAMEDHERQLPPPPTEESNPGAIQRHIEWREKHRELNAQLWANLKVMEPISENASTPHPFISILLHPKGKKLIPRIFHHIDEHQRTQMLTVIVLHLDALDVTRLAYPSQENPRPPPAVRDAIELFSQKVMQPLLSFVNEAQLKIVSGLLGLVVDRVNVPLILLTKIGVSMLTMLIARADQIRRNSDSATHSAPTQADWDTWTSLYGRLFDLAEPVLPYLFSTESPASAEDVHIWSFLATMGIAASPDQQQRLVLGVKDRVMETVSVAKTLPADMAAKRLGEVNLFMHAIGLDVELLG